MSWLRRFCKRITPANEKTFAFVRLNHAEDYLRCGWIPHDSLQNTSHGEYSVLMEYIDCGCREMPRPGHAAIAGNPRGGERG